MIVSTKKYIMALAATAVLALGLYGCGGGGGSGPETGGETMMPDDGETMMPDDGDGMMPDDPQSAEGLAGAIGLAVNLDDIASIYGNIVDVYADGSGSDYYGVSQAYSEYGGRFAYAIPWRNDANELSFDTSIDSIVPLQSELIDFQGHSLSVSENATMIAGASTSITTDEGHVLGAPWQVLVGTREYRGVGTLRVNVVTDADASDTLEKPWVGYGETDHEITLDSDPGLSPGHDWHALGIPSNGLEGTLNGTQGKFSCQYAYNCYLDLWPRASTDGYYSVSGDVVFSPDDGSADVVLSPSSYSMRVTTADYLSFGFWTYVPDDVSDTSAYDFGVFAGGGDLFGTDDLVDAEGSATYTGKAIGMYYADLPSNGLEVGSFTADVELTADFGMADDLGTVAGRVHSLDYDGSAPAFPTELALESTSAGGGSGYLDDETYAQGVVADDEANPVWQGEWSATFFGGTTSQDGLPGSVAGTFGAANGSNGLVGAYGAHKQP